MGRAGVRMSKTPVRFVDEKQKKKKIVSITRCVFYGNFCKSHVANERSVIIPEPDTTAVKKKKNVSKHECCHVLLRSKRISCVVYTCYTRRHRVRSAIDLSPMEII